MPPHSHPPRIFLNERKKEETEEEGEEEREEEAERETGKKGKSQLTRTFCIQACLANAAQKGYTPSINSTPKRQKGEKLS